MLFSKSRFLKLPTLRVSHRLAIAIILPLLGLLGFASVEVDRNFSALKEYSEMEALLRSVSQINEITSQLQNERSEAFRLGEGVVEKQAFEGATQTTDASLAGIDAIAAEIQRTDNVAANEALIAFQEALAGLPETRKGVIDGSLSSSGATFAYTGVIEAAINIQRSAGRATQSAPIALQAVALNSISAAKELASQEQSIVNGALAAGKFSKVSFEKYSQSITTQDVLLDLFLSQQNETARVGYEDVLNAPEVVAIKKPRGRIGRAGAGDNLPAKKFEDWQDISSARIAKLREIEQTALARINDASNSLSQSAQASLMLWGGLSILIAVLTIIQAFILARSITRPLANLTTSLRSLASGDLDANITGLERKDELGVMAGAVSQLKESAVQKVRLEEQAEETRHLSEEERKVRDTERANHERELQETVEALGEGLGRLARGDVSADIINPFTPELDQLRTDFNTAQDHLRSVLSAIAGSARSINGNTREMQDSADQLSRRTEQQAAALEQTAAALTEITETVRSAADGASEANKIAEKAFGSTQKSTQVVSEAISAMGKIQESSKKISQIISVMDEIAFQTNLLALNAGVEAARAGEAGKGFAVVAQEVRELAGRSAQAAKEIASLISVSTQDVQAGVKLVQDTGETLTEIEGHVQEIKTRINTIAESAREQSVGLGEVNNSVGHMDQMTQQNAAMVEETTASVHALGSEVNVLTEGLAGFQLESDGSKPTASAAA